MHQTKQTIRMKNYFNQKKWFRNLNKGTVYVQDSAGIWKPKSEWKKGELIKDVENGASTLAWCECGNELVHSESKIDHKEGVYEYSCSHCQKHQYWNANVAPGLHPCDKEGSLITSNEVPQNTYVKNIEWNGKKAYIRIRVNAGRKGKIFKSFVTCVGINCDYHLTFHITNQYSIEDFLMSMEATFQNYAKYGKQPKINEKTLNEIGFFK